ncbi:MAG: YihY/virulence factor BrkB family protein [Microthrixaceae bacterium]
MISDPLSPTPPLAPRALVRWLWQLTKDVVAEYSKDNVGDLAAAITFWTILSIPAAVLALVSALSSLEPVTGTSLAAEVETETQQFIGETLVDSETLSRAVDELFNRSGSGIAIVATLLALFTLSRAFAGLIRALDVAYEVEEGRPFWYVRIVAVGLGMSTIVVVAAAATFLAVLPSLGLGPVMRFLAPVAAISMLVVWAATLFHIGPNHKTPWRFDVPGAIFTALGWAVTTQLFAYYVRLSQGGNEVQSSIAAVLLALTLMYLLSTVLIIGAEINDVIARRSGAVSEVETVTERARATRDRFRPRR